MAINYPVLTNNRDRIAPRQKWRIYGHPEQILTAEKLSCACLICSFTVFTLLCRELGKLYRASPRWRLSRLDWRGSREIVARWRSHGSDSAQIVPQYPGVIFGDPVRRLVCGVSGGEGGIRTHGTVSGTPHFECGTFDHSATSPRDERHRRVADPSLGRRGL